MIAVRADRRTANRVLDLIDSRDGPSAVMVTGWAGVGRTTLLAEVGRTLRDQGRSVIEVRVARDGVLLGGYGDGPRLGPVDGAHADPALARRASAAVAAPLVAREAVVLIDDGQWLDRDTVAVLEALAYRVARTTVRYVCAIALPCPSALVSPGIAALRRLRAVGLAASVWVPALDVDETARVVREAVGAIPSPELVAFVRARGRGIAAAVAEAATLVRRAGGVRVVAERAYLGPDVAPDLSFVAADPSAPSLVDRVRGLGPEAWRAARTSAALAPTGSALPALLATALELPVAEALARLEELRDAGVLHHGPDGRWRFVVPLLAERLCASLGPYERRRLAALVVTAAWRGEARLSRPEFVDLVASAGRLLPTEQAHAELAAAGTEGLGRAPRRAARWWRAAAELAGNDKDRVRARLMYLRACALAGDASEVVAEARSLLDDGSPVPEQTRDDLIFMIVANLRRAGETEQLAAVADGTADGTAPWQGDHATRTVSSVLALAQYGRWGAAHTLLTSSRASWAARPATLAVGEHFQWLGELFAGRRDRSEALVVDGPPGEDEYVRRRVRRNEGVGVLLALGDVKGVRDLARRAGLAESDLAPSHRAVLALLDGRPDATESARRALLEPALPGLDPGRTILHQLLATSMLYRGHLATTRQLTEAARGEVPVLDHLLEVPDAWADLLLRDADSATARLEGALDRARDNDVWLGADLLLAVLVEVDRLTGDAARARAHARGLDEIAGVLRSPRAAMYVRFGRALADDDTAEAAECLRLAREGGQPSELAHVGLRLAVADLVDPAVLLKIYEFYGRFGDALLARAWTRSALEARGVPVPGRAVTKAENERLLGQLLTEGLTNRQIASVLGSSEKSVEGRLGRLLSRTGYRSRIELTTALLEGSFTF